jgi:allene oxide cyclase
MKRLLGLVLPLGGILVLVLVVSASGKGSTSREEGDRGSTGTFTLIEHATTDATTDTGAPGDTAGDVLTFANDLFDAKDATKVATDQGSCIRTVAGSAYECSWTNLLPGGQITVQGPFYDAADSTLAITGGTGRYKRARGTMDLESRNGGTEFAFTFHVTR